MEELLYTQGAFKLAKVNAGIKTGEQILIVADYKMKKISERIANAANLCGGEVY